MTSKTHLQTLFAFHWHTTNLLFDRAAELDPADVLAPTEFGHGSIHSMLFHILRADAGWRVALETGKQLSPLQAEDFPDLDSLRQGFAQEQAAWETLLDGLSDEDIESDVPLTNWRGDVVTFQRWRILQHLMLHGMQHHAELAHLLTQKGQSPGDLDFIFFSP